MSNIVTREILSQYKPPTYAYSDKNSMIDYAEVEIQPDTIQALRDSLFRYGHEALWTDSEWEDLNNPDSDTYEHIIAYVNYEHNTDTYLNMRLVVVTKSESEELNPNILSYPEVQTIIQYGKELIDKYRNRDTVSVSESNSDSTISNTNSDTITTERLHDNDVVFDYKWERLGKESIAYQAYLIITTDAYDTYTNKRLVVYQNISTRQVLTMPYELFTAKLDKSNEFLKNVRQEYKFAKLSELVFE